MAPMTQRMATLMVDSMALFCFVGAFGLVVFVNVNVNGGPDDTYEGQSAENGQKNDQFHSVFIFLGLPSRTR